MPEIGATLRETRMRKRIDISEVEAETKIRARYLRALENEEWDLLPGPTFVKTFLRTYGEYLELDSRSLVEEYKHRFERPTAEQLTPFAPHLGSRRQRRRKPPRLSPLFVLVLGVFALVGVLLVLGLTSDDDPRDEQPATRTTTTQPTDGPIATATAGRKKSSSSSSSRRSRSTTPRTVTVRLTAFKPVNVCMVDVDGRKVIDNENLDPATPVKRYKSRRFRLWVGNGDLQVRTSSRTMEVPDTARPAAYEITRTSKRLKRLSGQDNPCLP